MSATRHVEPSKPTTLGVAWWSIAICAVLLAENLGLPWLLSAFDPRWTDREGWNLLLAVPLILAAWPAGVLIARRFRGPTRARVVRWSIGSYLVIRVVVSTGGWFHGSVSSWLVWVVALPLASALGCWLGVLWTERHPKTSTRRWHSDSP